MVWGANMGHLWGALRSSLSDPERESDSIYQDYTRSVGAGEFRRIYNRRDFRRCLDRLEFYMYSLRYTTQEEKALRWAWSKDYDLHSYNNVNRDRRTAKGFLMRLCECRYLAGAPTLAQDELLELLGTENGRLIKIIKVCLLLDRANAWYNLENNNGNNTKGKHWYAEIHHQAGHALVTADVRRTNQVPGHDEHTINKRFMLLINDDSLQTILDQDVHRLLEPARSPNLGFDDSLPCIMQCWRGISAFWKCVGGTGVAVGLLTAPLYVLIQKSME